MSRSFEIAGAVYTAGMDATVKPKCVECEKEIDGEVVWFAPLSNAQRVDGQTLSNHLHRKLKAARQWPPVSSEML